MFLLAVEYIARNRFSYWSMGKSKANCWGLYSVCVCTAYPAGLTQTTMFPIHSLVCGFTTTMFGVWDFKNEECTMKKRSAGAFD